MKWNDECDEWSEMIDVTNSDEMIIVDLEYDSLLCMLW